MIKNLEHFGAGNIEKIHPELLNVVSTLNARDVECFLYSNDYDELAKQLEIEKICAKGYPFMNCFFARLNSNKILHLSKYNNVNYITKSANVFALVDHAKEFMRVSSLPYSAQNCEANIAFIDTGISPHLDFLLPHNKIIHFKDFVNNRALPYDDNGHGTFIAGVCCSSGVCSQFKYSGVAKNCNIIMLKALNHAGETNSNTILDAMQYIYDIKDKYNIKVVCMSFGADYSGENDPLQKGALALWNSGLIVVAAAGNSGPDSKTIKSPGTGSRIITVGGLDDGRNDSNIKIADFSSRGPINSRFKPDIVAPSVDITSTSNLKNKSFYTQMSGTSVATPMIAGVCAMIKSLNPTFSPDKVKHHLLNMCTPLTRNKNEEGYGYFSFE